VPLFKNRNPQYEVRVSLLEERLQAYDEVSRQMLAKLEQAVEKISESTRDISQILIRHEERIDRTTEASNALIQLLNKTEHDVREKIQDESKVLSGRINDISEHLETNRKSIEELKKTRWVWVGIITATSFFASQLNIFDNILQNRDGYGDRNTIGYVREK
jgi:seryl-tRNA synthetase